MNWISVKDKWPEDTEKHYAAINRFKGFGIMTPVYECLPNGTAYYEWMFYSLHYNGRSGEITHWMPLPEPPEKDNKLD